MATLARSTSTRFVLKRLAQAVPVLLGVSFLTFSLMNLLPGGTARALAGEGATPEQIHAIEVRLDLDQPFLVRYWDWLTGAARGDFGTSLATGEPVTHVVTQRLPVTLELGLLAMTLAVSCAIVVSLLAVRRPGGIADRLSVVVCMAGISVPQFVVGILLILVFAVHLQWFPAIGYTPISEGLWANLRTVLLGACALGFVLFSLYVRILRADLMDQLQGEDYVVVARAKGIPPQKILVRHVLRNSIFSLITVIGLNLGVVIGGTVLIEQIYALPGVGQALIQAVHAQDVVVVQAIVMVLSVAVVGAGLLTDLLYAVLDPRIRYGRPNS